MRYICFAPLHVTPPEQIKQELGWAHVWQTLNLLELYIFIAPSLFILYSSQKTQTRSKPISPLLASLEITHKIPTLFYQFSRRRSHHERDDVRPAGEARGGDAEPLPNRRRNQGAVSRWRSRDRVAFGVIFESLFRSKLTLKELILCAS